MEMEKMNYPTTPEGKEQMNKDGQEMMSEDQKEQSEIREFDKKVLNLALRTRMAQSDSFIEYESP